MAVPVYSVGQILNASDCNLWFMPKAAYVTTAQHWTNNTVTNVTELVLAVDASAMYDLSLTLLYEAPTAGDGQLAWTLPSGTTQVNTCLIALPSTAAASADLIITAGTSAPAFGGLGAGNSTSLVWRSTVTTSTTAGNIQLRAAQLVTSATSDLIIGAGSIMTLQRIG